MTLHVHRAERSDRLVAALADLLADPLPDPFASEVVCVPTQGVERWLLQELSRRLGTSAGDSDGVCTGVDFPSPRRLVGAIRAQVLGADPTAPDPWRPEVAVWSLLEVIDAGREEPWAQLLWSSFRRDGASSARRWSTARHLADLFAGYAATRPEMVERWRRGEDVDASGSPLPPDRVWQAELFRRLRVRIEWPSPAEQTEQTLLRLSADDTVALDLPPRLSVFGATRLDPDHLQVLAALARQREVHLWLPHPSPALWQRLRALPSIRRRADDHSETLVAHPLLGYLARDSRELQRSLTGLGTDVVDHHEPAPAGPAPTLLGWLQADLAADRVPEPSQRPVLRADDHSVAVHASHGPDRQVEVLREVLVGLLADDSSLQPRDVIVMCPDIETYAPLIAATFGLSGPETSADHPDAEHPGHRLRVRLADRSLRQLNPLLAIVADLVGMAGSRMTATQLLDLCASGPVARRFGFRADDLERLRELVTGAGIRWGLDADHRAPYGMAAFRQNTWSAGLDRLLLGVTMDESDQHFIGTTLPMDDVDSADVDLVGRLVECVRRVETVTDAFNVRQDAASWVGLLKRSLDLLTSVPAGDSWQLTHAYAELGRIAEAAATAGDDVQLGLAEIAALLAEAFRGRPTRANFRTGTLTMCTLTPMRSVPHRVVCLLGVDDGVFPRPRRVDGDDLRVGEEWIGDRNERSEDRQLLLDAITSAQERLVVVYAGLNPRTGVVTPPAVPVSELLAALDSTARTVDGRSVAATITTTHPLQPFDRRNFVVETARGRDTPFSFDQAALRAVRAADHGTSTPAADGPVVVQLPEVAGWLPTIADLQRFYAHPPKALLRDRAALSTWREDETSDEQLPVDLDGLGRWDIGERLLQERLRGRALDALVAAEWRRGTLPPQVLGQRTVEPIRQSVQRVAEAASPFLTGPAERHEIEIELPGVRLTGAVPRVFGHDLVRVTYSRLSGKHRLQSWIELLALTVAVPDRPWRAVTIGMSGQSVLGPLPADGAARVLADLLDLQRVGLSQPLPFAPRTSADYAYHRERDRAVSSFAKALAKPWGFERDATYEQFFGVGVSVDDLLHLPPVPGEARWGHDESSRFGVLARRVFSPLLTKEELT